MLREKWKAESERSESLTEKVQELETTMSRDCEENTRKISEMEATHQQQRKVNRNGVVLGKLWYVLCTVCTVYATITGRNNHR